MMRRLADSSLAMPLTLVLLAGAAMAYCWTVGGYVSFVIALVALTTVVGAGLNILVGLTGQISLGHVGFYALGAYTVAILTLQGVDFWWAMLAAGLLNAAVGALLALPAMRVSGPYLAMVTIAFGFIVEHAIIELRDLTGGQNGLMGFSGPAIGGYSFDERDLALSAIVLAALALLLFHRLAGSGWGRAMIAVRDAESAARSIGLQPLVVKTAAFTLSAALTGLAGALYAPLIMFVAPSSFSFSQSILFLFAVIVGGVGRTLGPLVGAVVTVLLPELLSGLAEYRLLFFGGMLLVVLWLAPSGIVGMLAALFTRTAAARPVDERAPGADAARALLATRGDGRLLQVEDIGISFGGVRAADQVSLVAHPGEVTSLIGPNGAGKTTVLNMIGGFYRPDQGRVRLGERELAGCSATRVARAGIARTYQTTRLFSSLSVLDNILLGLRHGAMGNPLRRLARPGDVARAGSLLAMVGYRGDPQRRTGDLPHVDRRLVEIARALALRPRVLLLDEPAAGLSHAEKDALATLLREIADAGIAVLLVEHDMGMVMSISDQVVVLDAGTPIAAGPPAAVRVEPAVVAAYLGAGEMKTRPRRVPHDPSGEVVLQASALTAGYGAAPVLDAVDLGVAAGELVGLLGANGAGKSTTLRAIAGLLRPVHGAVRLRGVPIERRAAHEVARRGLALVPEGRQVFPELTVLDNIRLGAYRRGGGDFRAEIEALLTRFPRLRERLGVRAGLLSGGEQQMLAVARGLMSKPDILLLDEPSLGLAPAMIDELFDVLAELRDEGITILVVDQMAAITLSVADRGYVLEQGRVVGAGSAESLKGDPALEAAYLGGERADADGVEANP